MLIGEHASDPAAARASQLIVGKSVPIVEGLAVGVCSLIALVC